MIKSAFIPCRMGSTRLPGKHILKIEGREILAHLIDRIKTSHVDNIVVCTTTKPEDERLVDIAKRENVDYFQGNPEDILDRYYQASKKFGTDFIINVDGDDLFCDPEYIDRVILRFKMTDCDSVYCNGLPYGVAPFGFKVSALKSLIDKGYKGDTNWGKFFKQPDLITETIQSDKEHNRPDIRLSLDTKEDYELMKSIYHKLYKPDKIITLKEVIDSI